MSESLDKKFGACEICGNDSWSIIYQGPIRAGNFGSTLEGARLARCGKCGVSRLAEDFSIDAKAYESSEYRKSLEQGMRVEDFYHHADPHQIYHLTATTPYSWRGKTVADIGCGAGSFIDHIAGVADKIIAVEPTQMYHESLRARGYEVFNYATEAVKAKPASVDYAVTFQVIEHVLNPREFLSDIKALLKPGGNLLVATPNADDILMKLLPDSFPAFFFRMAHRWYFTMESLRKCAEAAGFTVESERYLHTMTMSNMLGWVAERRPTGNLNRRPGINEIADKLWSSYLEASGQADTLFIQLRKD